MIDLIRYAYGFNTIALSSQVVGGPSWIRVDRFDIVATADGQLTLPMLCTAYVRQAHKTHRRTSTSGNT